MAIIRSSKVPEKKTGVRVEKNNREMRKGWIGGKCRYEPLLRWRMEYNGRANGPVILWKSSSLFFISQIINIIITRSKRTISVWMCLFRIHISYRYDFFELIDYTWNVICVIVCVCFFLIQYNICNVSVFRTRYGLVLVFFFIPSICSTHCISFKIKHYNAYNQNAQMEWLKMQCAKATYRIFIKKIKDEKCEDLSTE